MTSCIENHSIPLKLCSFLVSIIPGISKVLVFYPVLGKTHSAASDGAEGIRTEQCLPELEARLTPYLQQVNPWDWFSDADLPYQLAKQPMLQRTVFSEEHNRVLLIRLTADDGKNPFLLFFHFPENFQWTGRDRQHLVLSTDHKSLISFLLYHTARQFLTGLIQNHHNQQKLSDAIDSLGSQLINKRVEIQQQAETGYQWKVETIRFFAREYSQVIQHEIIVDSSAIDYLARSSSAPAQLKELVNKAVDLALLSPSAKGGEVVVFDYHLIASQGKVVAKAPSESGHNVVADRTLALLDRLEMAANKALEMGEAVTGQSIGRHCSPAITPPAISDALKKHKIRLNLLLAKYPDRWITLRSRFKPVQNLLTLKNGAVSAQTA